MLYPDDIPIEIDREIRAANAGRLPRNQREYERLASRFDHTVQYFPVCLGERRACVSEGVIYVPELPPGGRPTRCHIHELAHACERWEGHEPWVLPASQNRTHHDFARCVDLLDPGRPYLTQDLERKIARTAGALAQLLEAAGYQSAYVGVRPGYRPTVDLGYKS